MIDSLQAVLLALTAAINSSQSEVRIESQALAAPSTIMALEGARKKGVPVQVVLGAKAEYTLDSKGQPSGGNRPYDSGPQAMEIRALDAMRASVFIPPAFSELDRPVFEPGVEMNANFAIVDNRWAALCTGPLSSSAQGLCWTTKEPRTISNLSALHSNDRKDDQTAQSENDIGKKLASSDLIVTPGNETDFLMLLKQSWRNVVVSTLAEGKVLDALLGANKPGTLWTASNGTYSRSALDRFKRAGWSVKQLQIPFHGIALTSNTMAYIGSQKIDTLQIEKSRALGIVLPPKHVQQIEEILQLK